MKDSDLATPSHSEGCTYLHRAVNKSNVNQCTPLRLREVKKKRKKERKKKKILHKLTKVNQIVPVSFAKDHAHISMH